MSAWRIKKPLCTAVGTNVLLPSDVRAEAGIAPGPCFVAMRAIGPCIVVCQIGDGAYDWEQEAKAKVNAAMEAWTKEP